MQSNIKQSYVDRAREGVLKWLESVRDTSEGWGCWKYNAHMLRPRGLISSRIALQILDRLGPGPAIRRHG